MSHADALLNLCENYAYALASASKVSENRAEYLASRDKHRAALREACEKLCGALERNLVLISKFAMSHRYCPMCHAFLLDQMHSAACPIVVEHEKTTAALAHLTKGTA